MRIAFCGSDEFSLRCLKHLTSKIRLSKRPDTNQKILEASEVAVICSENATRIRNFCEEIGVRKLWSIANANDFQQISIYKKVVGNSEVNAPVLVPEWISKAMERVPRNPTDIFDVFLVVSFKFIFPEIFLQSVTAERKMQRNAEKKLIKPIILNIHPSHLPRFRGASPLFHSLLFGDCVSALSLASIAPVDKLMNSAQSVDTGSIMQSVPFCLFLESFFAQNKVIYPTYSEYMDMILAASTRMIDKLLTSWESIAQSCLPQNSEGNFCRLESFFRRLVGKINSEIFRLHLSYEPRSIHKLKRLRCRLTQEKSVLSLKYNDLACRSQGDLGYGFSSECKLPLYTIKAPKIKQIDDIGRLCFVHMTNHDIFLLSKALDKPSSACVKSAVKARKIFGKSMHCSLVTQRLPTYKKLYQSLSNDLMEKQAKNYHDLQQSRTVSTEHRGKSFSALRRHPHQLKHCVLNIIYPICHSFEAYSHSCSCEACSLRKIARFINSSKPNEEISQLDSTCHIYCNALGRILCARNFLKYAQASIEHSECPFESDCAPPSDTEFTSKSCAHRYAYLRFRESLPGTSYKDQLFQDNTKRVFLRRSKPELCYACHIPPGSVYVPKYQRYTFTDSFGNVDANIPSVLWILCADYSILSVSSLTLSKCEPVSTSLLGYDLQSSKRLESFYTGFGLKRGVLYPGLLAP